MRKPNVCVSIDYIKNFFYCFLLSIFLFSCNNDPAPLPHLGEKIVADRPEDLNARTEEVIEGTLKDILQSNKKVLDSFKIKNPVVVQYIYAQNSFQPLWSLQGKIRRSADSLITFIDSCHKYGLYPEDYNNSKLSNLKVELISDTSKEKRLNATSWAYEDLLLTSAFVQVVTDLKSGRLLPDSIIVKDTTLTPAFYQSTLKSFFEKTNEDFASSLEPKLPAYQNIKEALQLFLQNADFKKFTYVSTLDSSQIPALVYKRIGEEDSTLNRDYLPDSVEISRSIKKYQKAKHLHADGKITADLVNLLNNTDREKFIRIAINMDRYKQLTSLPEKYLWVNLPSYTLQLRDSDTVLIKSKIVIGKPDTRTPELTSAISDMITYPQWHIPESIIKKEILPGLKRDPGYTISKGLSIIDDHGTEIDPYLVDWSKYKNSIPYNVIQGSGDENALGILKFNFPNKYSVYLHDTNQRYLFSKKSRALSHGCVRVQAWDKLALYILRNDSTYFPTYTPIDSLNRWLELKQKHYIPVHKPIPLYIRYITCEAKEGKMQFFDDVYNEDQRIRVKLFADK
jgi:murein L,D-transpeptidase YcbB/YkuD